MDLSMTHQNNVTMLRRREMLEEALLESRLEKALSQRLVSGGILGSAYGNNPILDLLARERALNQQRDLANIAALTVKHKLHSFNNNACSTPTMTTLSLLSHLSANTKSVSSPHYPIASTIKSSYPDLSNAFSSFSALQQQQQEQQHLATTSSVIHNKAPKQQQTKPRRRPKRCNAATISFPTKLFKLLESASTESFEDVISFLPHGRGFMIHKPEQFSKDILPKFFKTGRLSSFHRQLNLYGFKRITYGADTGAFYHEHFDRDDEKVVAKIERKKQRVPEGDATRGAADRMAVLRALNIAAAQSYR